jgi:predicted HTH transcriptional regulator
MISGGVADFNEKQEAYTKFFRFIIDKRVEMIEDYNYEFKEIKGGNPLNSINSTIAAYATSFLNGKGGRIYYGISDDRVVKGVKVTPEKNDEINRIIYSNLSNIQPAVSPDYYEIIYHPVGSEDGSEINELFVIEISVPITNDQSAVFYVNGTELHVRVNGVKKKLIGTEITSYIKKRVLEEGI